MDNTTSVRDLWHGAVPLLLESGALVHLTNSSVCRLNNVTDRHPGGPACGDQVRETRSCVSGRRLSLDQLDGSFRNALISAAASVMGLGMDTNSTRIVVVLSALPVGTLFLGCGFTHRGQHDLLSVSTVDPESDLIGTLSTPPPSPTRVTRLEH